MNDRLPHRRGTLVGENPGSDLATIAGLLAIATTSIAASYVLARMSDAPFAGIKVLYAWAPWVYSTINVYGGYYWPWCKTIQLTAYGVSILHAIEITWAVGAGLSLTIFVVVNRLAAPKPDISGVKDSARMANPRDLYEAGFIAGD